MRKIYCFILLIQAAELGDLDKFIYLHQIEKIDLMAVDAHGKSAAHKATAHNHVNILRYMLFQVAGQYDKSININNFKNEQLKDNSFHFILLPFQKKKRFFRIIRHGWKYPASFSC